jgi:membrane protease YdiL (CAAX protease family)
VTTLATGVVRRPDAVRRPGAVEAVALTAAFAAAVTVRVAVAGPAGARSIPAGLVFAAALTVMCVLARTRVVISARAVAVGLAGAAVLLVPVLVAGSDPHVRAGGYASWAVATALVATAEEAFLRGALFDAVTRWRGADAAVVVGAVAFAALHVPMYGWHVLPLDLAVGVGLGALRLLAGTWTAPAVAHVGADLAGWWLL